MLLCNLQFSEDLTFLHQAALKKSKIKIKDPKMSINMSSLILFYSILFYSILSYCP